MIQMVKNYYNRGLVLKQLIETIIWHIIFDEPNKDYNKIKISELTFKGGKAASRDTYYRILRSLCDVGVLKQEGKSYMLTDAFRQNMRNNIKNLSRFKQNIS